MDWFIISGLAAVVVGAMEFLKGFIPKDLRDRIHSNIYRLALACVATGIAFIKGGDVVINAIAITALAQIAYDAFVTYIKGLVGKGGTPTISINTEGK